MNKWVILSATLFAILSGVLSGVLSSNVKAASAYDDLEVVEELYISSPDGTKSEEVTTSYMQIAESTCFTEYQTVIDKMNNGLNPAWAIVQHQWPSNNNKWVYIFVTDDVTGAEADFFSTGVSRTLSDNNNPPANTWYKLGIGIRDNGTYRCTTNAFNLNGFWEQSISDSNYWNKPLLMFNISINYPSNYEGEIIPDTWTPPVVFDPELSAKYSWSDKSIVFEDTTVYDVMPDECWVQMPNNAYGDNFTEYYFDCNSKPPIGHTIEALEYQSYTIIQFARLDDTTVSENYSITIDGGSGDSEIGAYSASNFFNQCIDSNAPYIHVNDCQDAFGVIANKLSFGKINPFSDIRYSQLTECRQLEVLGSWINYESKLVCPAFSSSVRNVVTPFMAFGLSLTALGYILNRSAKDFQ